MARWRDTDENCWTYNYSAHQIWWQGSLDADNIGHDPLDEDYWYNDDITDPRNYCTPSLGDFITWAGPESSTRYKSFNYQYVCTAANTYSWERYSDEQDTMTSLGDIMSLVDETSHQSSSKAVEIVNRLVANEVFAKSMSAIKVLFQDYCGSITSQNPTIGDMMIYMGKNPRLSSVAREFQFAISEYLGKVGQQEMWSDKLITKILASGLLALNVTGCVQTTEEVYSRVGEDWKSTFSLTMTDNYVYNLVADPFFDKFLIFCYDGTFYETEDFTSVIQNNSLKTSLGNLSTKNFMKDCCITIVNNQPYAFAIGSNQVFMSSDLNTWNEISYITQNTGNSSYCSHGFWKAKGVFCIKQGNKLFLTNDFSTWSHITLSNSVIQGSLYFTNDYIVVIAPNTTDCNLIDLSLSLESKISPFSESWYIYQVDNNLYSIASDGLYEANSNLSLSSRVVSWELPDSVSSIFAYYRGRIYFGNVKTSPSYKFEIKYIDLENNGIFVDTGFSVTDSGTPYIRAFKDVLTFFKYDDGNSAYISTDGLNFKAVPNPNSDYNPNHIVKIYDLNLLVTMYAYIDDNDIVHYQCYTSKGREAGSGIIAETGTRTNGSMTFSNNQKLAWGDYDSTATYMNTNNRTILPLSAPSNPQNGDIWIE